MQSSNTGRTGTEWSEATKRTVAIAGVLIGLFVLYISRPVLAFIIVAGILAFLLNPIVAFFHRRLRLPYGLAVILTYLLLLIAIVLLLLILTPAVVDAVSAIDIDVVQLLDKVSAGLQRMFESIRYVQVLRFRLDLSSVVDPALETLSGVVPEAMIPSTEQIFSSIPSALDLATGFASTLVSTLLWAILAFVFTLLYAIYISLDLPRFGSTFWELVPDPYRAEYAQLWNHVRKAWTAFFRGQLILSLTIGAVVAIGNAALGVPAALLLGILAGLLEALPNIGPILAAVPALLLALLQGSSVLPVSNFVFALIVGLFYFFVQQLENSIVVPRLIGQALDLPAVLVMAGVVVGASVGGILGAFMAAPIIATGRILAQYAYNKILGRPPFPPDITPALTQKAAGPLVAVTVSSNSPAADDRLVEEHPANATGEERERAGEIKDTSVSLGVPEG
jgi:predicted PurR-regulated permease PerM